MMKYIFSPCLVLYLYVVCVFTPIISSFYSIVPLTLGMLFFVLTFRKFVKLRDSFLLSIFAIIGMSFIYKIIGYSTASWGNYGNRFFWICSIWAGFYMWQFARRLERRTMLIVLLTVFVVNLVYAIQIRTLIPDLSIAYRHADSTTDVYGRLNIGGTDYNYCVIFAGLFFFIYILKYRHALSFKLRVILYGLFAFLTYFISFYGDSATALISYFIGIFALLIEQRYKKNFMPLFLLSLFIILSLVLVFSDMVVSFITDIAGEKIGVRIAAITHLSGGKVEEDDEGLFSRFPLMFFDLKMWLSSIKSIFFGWGYHAFSAENMEISMMLNKSGGHSAIVNVLPRFGLLGAVFLWHLLKAYKRYNNNLFRNIGRTTGNIIFFIVIFNNVLNITLDANVLFILFFLYPFLEGAAKNQFIVSSNEK